ncbi:MAG: hypothetical protein U9R15_13830 [Chloroflexota bacterium]|nr:hypothetical protein [Chloroflexota bacterium]
MGFSKKLFLSRNSEQRTGDRSRYNIRRTSTTLLSHYERLVEEQARRRAESQSE